jgi:hypothetical protein
MAKLLLTIRLSKNDEYCLSAAGGIVNAAKGRIISAGTSGFGIGRILLKSSERCSFDNLKIIRASFCIRISKVYKRRRFSVKK